MAATELSFPIRDLFPQEEWQKACEKDPVLKPIYLMVNGKDSKIVNLSLDQLKDCNVKEPKFGLTVLSVAAMTRNHATLKYLLFEKKVNPNPIDKAGLSPLHYACAIGDADSISELQKAMLQEAKPQETQKVKTVAEDIFELFPGWRSMLTEPPMEQESEFFKQTHAHYFDGVTTDRENFCLLLKERLTQWDPSIAQSALNDELVRQFEIREKESDLLTLDKQEGADLGAFAKKDIKAGELIGIYGGKINYKENLENLAYLCNHVDGLELRDYVDMVNDSFPNSELRPLYLPDGRVYQCLMALNDIKKGKAVFNHYGFEHRIKTLERKELNLEEMASYFTKNSVFDLCKFMNAHSSSEIKDIKLLVQFEEIMTKLRYLYQTPSALISLYLKGIVTDQDLRLIEQKDFLRFLQAHHFDQLEVTLNTCKSVLAAYDALQKGKNGHIFFPDLKEMGFTLLEKYQFRVFLSVIVFMMDNEKKMANRWNSEKQNIMKMAEVLNLIYSGFSTPQKEKRDEAYLKLCKKSIENLPKPIYKQFIHDTFKPNLTVELKEKFTALFSRAR